MTTSLLDLPAAPAPERKVITLEISEPNVRPVSEWGTSAYPTGQAGWSKPPVGDSPDLQRVLALDRRPPFDEHWLAQANDYMGKRLGRSGPCDCVGVLERHGIKPMADPCIKSLWKVQGWTLFEILQLQGSLGLIGVGFGKTLLDLLTPLVMPDCRLAVLLVPPELVSQLIVEYERIQQHFKVPSLVVHGKDYTAISDQGVTLHVFPYSRLSRPESTVWLEHVQPDTIIADECHRLRNPQSAGTSRVLRYFGNHPETRFCGWTGSMTDASLSDYGHLACLALREKSPLPLDPVTLKDWGRAIDPGNFPAPAGALLALCDKGEPVQSGFHRRLIETPGVIATKESSVEGDLEIVARKAPKIPQTIRDMLAKVRNDQVRPDGEELVNPLTIAKCAREVAQGFYYRWRFPPINGVPQRKDDIDEWFDARKDWHREMRDFLKAREEHLDSPLLCLKAAQRAWGDVQGDPSLPQWKAASWPRWRDTKHTVVYESEAIRVDDYLAQDAAQWAKDNLGVVWYAANAFGQWVAELSGLPLHGGGPEAGALIARERGETSIIASVKAHGTGRNGLQYLFHDQLVASPPSSSARWEQLLGRLFRPGQTAPKTFARFYDHTPEMRQALVQARRRSEYVQNTTGADMKLLIGMIDGEEYDDEDGVIGFDE